MGAKDIVRIQYLVFKIIKGLPEVLIRMFACHNFLLRSNSSHFLLLRKLALEHLGIIHRVNIEGAFFMCLIIKTKDMGTFSTVTCKQS